MMKAGAREILDRIEALTYDDHTFDLARDAMGEAEIHDGFRESYMRVKDANGDEFYVIVKAVEPTV